MIVQTNWVRPHRALLLCAVGALQCLHAPLAVQAQEVVQQLPNPASERLTEALRRLSRAPESLPALIAAGRASLELDDVDAASGFFARARAVSPDDGAVLSGLALVSLRQEDPVAALDLFDRAQAAGENLDGYAADRGLAFDLIGQNARAQELYGQALSRDENAETVRRLALSYAIAGDQAASEAILLPLLQRRDLAAYRTRAFALAILGREDEAVSIAETMLPPRISRRMGPYLRYMQRLTPAQQAAAANLGSFPRAADIGRDEPRLARSAAAPLPSSPSSSVDARLIPGGAALGSPADELPALASAAPVASEPEPRPSFSISEEEPEQAAVVAVSVPAAQTPPQEPAPLPAPAPAAPVVVAEEEPVSLADVFADFSIQGEATAPVATPGAVDITAIVPVREQRAPEPPPPPAHPSRHWVQVATGQDLAAFRFDWRRLVRNADGLLDDRSAYRARWNQTNRLLTGPFDSARAAQEFVTALGNAGVDAFRFTSAEGEEVTALN